MPDKTAAAERSPPDTPQSPSPYPPLPDDEAADALDDLLASFPRPLDWDTSFDDLGSMLMVQNPPAAASFESFYTVSTEQPRSPLKPIPPNKELPLPPDHNIYRSRSKSGKRVTEAVTPTRPFKRLKEAFSPKSRGSPRSTSVRRSPSKIPLPASPTRRTHASADLDQIINAFQHTRDNLSRAIGALDTVRMEFSAEKLDAEETRNTIVELMDEKRRTNIEILEIQRVNDTLREDLRKVRADGGRAAQEAQGMIAHLEGLLAKEKALSATLRTEVNDLARRNHFMEQSTDRRMFELQQDLDTSRQETAKAKGELAELKGKLDEAEFAHRALKEGGAKLARELADKERKVDELEKHKGAKRWGMI